jgi:hypothetical protein
VAAPFLTLIMTGAVTIILVALYQQSQQPDATTKDVLFAAVFATLVLVMGGFIVGLGLSWIVAAARHWTALRVDQDGVTLGRRPFPGSRPVTVPWSDIETIVVFGSRGLWDLDPDQVVAATNAFAPRDVELVDAV